MEFYKYNALGNDFIFFETACPFNREELAFLARENEIGADGLVFLTPNQETDCRFEIYNKDGSQAEICGNALRAVGYHLHRVKAIGRDVYTVTLGSRTVQVGLSDDGYYVELEAPTLLSETATGAICKAPNLHLIQLVKRVDIARLYETGSAFKDYMNTHELMKINESTYAFISYEKGVGLTDSCVSGAVSAFEYLNKQGLASLTMTFKTIGGDLKLSRTETGKIRAEGPVRLVYKGEFDEKTVFETA